MRDGYVYRLSLRELGIAAGISKRSVQVLQDEGLLPEEDGVRRLKRVAIVGAFMTAGFALLAAGRLASQIAFEYSTYDGEAVSNLQNISSEMNKRFLGQSNINFSDDLAVYGAARINRQFLIPGCPLPHDLCFEIIDGTQMFSTYHDPKLAMLGAVEGREYFAEIRPTGRGNDAIVIPNYELPERTDEWIRQKVFNAVSTLRINSNLAVRNTYERLLDYDPKIIERVEYP